MKSVSLATSLKPVMFVLHLSGLLALPDRDRKKFHCLKRLLNFLIAVLAGSELCLGIVSSVCFVMHIDFIASMYLLIYQIGELYLLVIFRCCQTSVQNFFDEFESYRRQHGVNIGQTNYRSVLIIGIVANIFLVVQLGATFAYSGSHQCQFVCSPLTEFISAYYCAPIYTALSVFFLGQLFNGYFWFYLTVWRILQLEANDIVRKLINQEKEALKQKPETIEVIRLRHADLCHVIATANRFMSHMLAAFYGTAIPCLLLFIHGFIYNLFNLQRFVNMANFFFWIVIQLILITLTGTSLNTKMHKPVDFLFQLDVNQMAGRGTEIVSAFLARVQGAPIGFRVYNLFTLDSSTILMICGTILTYALVIVQFQPNGLTGQSASQQQVSNRAMESSTITETTHT